METDEHRLFQRQKQIEIGKLSPEYQWYVRCQDTKKPYIPIPNIYEKRSKRSFDGLVREWKRRLYEWSESSLFVPDQSICCYCNEKTALFVEEISLKCFCGKTCQRKEKEQLEKIKIS